MPQFSGRGQDDGPEPVLPEAPMTDFYQLHVCQPSTLPGTIAATEAHTRHVEGVRQKTHVDDVSSYMGIGALSTSI